MDRMNWNSKTANRTARLVRVSQALGAKRAGKLVATDAIATLLEAVLEPGDRVCLEGNNQKQADFLAKALVALAEGNLYTGPNTEDTPVIAEATAFSGGIVIAQVNELVDGKTTTLPRIDIPADWVSYVVKAPRPNFIEPLFTRDPAQISEIQVLMAMMAIKGIYAEYGVQRLNHGIGFDTAAIELLLPTYGESLGLKGKICKHLALNPHPALIPAIEAGWVESVHSFGSELGMEDYIRARSDVFFTGLDGSLRSNRAFCQAAGHYACDLFIGSTLQIDLDGNSSTATLGRISGFGGAPNMGADARGRRQ